jgi:hypothetical protein
LVWAEPNAIRYHWWHFVGHHSFKYFSWEKAKAGSGMPLAVSPLLPTGVGIVVNVLVWARYLENLFFGVELEHNVFSDYPSCSHLPEAGP